MAPAQEDAYGGDELARMQTDLREPYRIPFEYLKDTQGLSVLPRPEAPLIVFVNFKSGGRMGPALSFCFNRALSKAQVFDLSQYRPNKVLQKIWDNFAEAEAAGDPNAKYYRDNLRILAAGGDGTVAWLMKTIKDLNLQPPPPIAIMPLGTGNDLSRSFNWGPAFMNGWIASDGGVYATLRRIALAKPALLDSWNVRLELPRADLEGKLPYGLSKIPSKGPGPMPGTDGGVQFSGMFWNYLSVGMDAQAAWGFSDLRDRKPHLASSRAANQFWYSYYSCTSGWFCGAPHVTRKLEVQVKKSSAAEWTALSLPRGIHAVCLLNLPSYGGGRNIWGFADEDKLKAKNFLLPAMDDGLIEVLGFKDGYRTAVMMGTHAKVQHAKRLAQAWGVRLLLRGGSPVTGENSLIHMQIDGEPWPQMIPCGASEAPVVLEVTHEGTSRLLRNELALDLPWPTPEKVEQAQASRAASPVAAPIAAPLAVTPPPALPLTPQATSPVTHVLPPASVSPPPPTVPAAAVTPAVTPAATLAVTPEAVTPAIAITETATAAAAATNTAGGFASTTYEYPSNGSLPVSEPSGGAAALDVSVPEGKEADGLKAQIVGDEIASAVSPSPVPVPS